MADTLELIQGNPWLLQPGDKVVASFAAILAAEPVFAEVFGESIYPYKRMDIGARELPALRIYSDAGHKEGETWYAGSDLTIDCIFPLSTRRDDLQAFADTVTAALMAEFRRPSVLAAMREQVPGLNRIGWTLDYDKGLMFQPDDETDPVPMTQIVADWRVLLAEWDRYLEGDARTVDEPFQRTLAALKTINFSTFAQTEDQPDVNQVTETTAVTGLDKPPQEE